MTLLAALLVVLICTLIGSLVGRPGLGLLIGVCLAAYVVWANSPSPPPF